MIKRLLKNPVILNPLTRWLASVLLFFKMKCQNPTSTIYDNVMIRKSTLGKYVTIYWNSSLNECEIGDATYIGPDSKFCKTKVGKFCSIAQNVSCGLGKHPTQGFVSTHPAFYSTDGQSQLVFADRGYYEQHENICIGNDVWIGAAAMIMDGVVIGDGAIIAAGAIVTKDVPAYAIVAGVPARVMRYRFTADQIEFLQKFRWWDKELEWIKANWKKFHDVEALCAEFAEDDKSVAKDCNG